MNGYDIQKAYTKRYDVFCGVDFGPERSVVSPTYFSYAKNVFKDYKKGGQAIESLPGFRLAFNFKEYLENAYPLIDFSSVDLKVYGTFCYEHLTSTGRTDVLLTHSGTYLFAVKDYDKQQPQITLLSSQMNAADSAYFLFDNVVYILDGKNYLCYDGTALAAVSGYVPTTVTGIIPDGELRNAGERLEQANVLTGSFKNQFVVTGTATDFYLSESGVTSVTEVTLYGQTVSSSDYTFDALNNKITFTTAPSQDLNYDEGYPALVVTASVSNRYNPISKCTVCCVYDNTAFFSGNPEQPGRVYFSALNNPRYVGELNYVCDGRSNSAVVAMVNVGDGLMVLKDAAEHENAVYIHRSKDTEINLKPRDYPSVSGVEGVGCVSQAINFLDDVVYLSANGLKAVRVQNANGERSTEKRSSHVDAKLLNCNLKQAKMAEWQGYLWIVADGKAFMADSRSRFKNLVGEYEYDWFYAEEIGLYEGQYRAFRYADRMPEYLMASDVKLWDGTQKVVNTPDENGLSSVQIIENEITVSGTVTVYYTVAHTITDFDGNNSVQYYLTEPCPYFIGGTFCAATTLTAAMENLLFGTSNGCVCIFNFDMRVDGEFPSAAYSANGRIFPSVLQTISDCCGIVDSVKNTVPHSLSVKVRALSNGKAKLSAVTDRDGFFDIGELDCNTFSFNDVTFSAFTFVINDQNVAVFNEKLKNWKEKQIVVYSDEYQKPFALYRIAYDYAKGRKIK